MPTFEMASGLDLCGKARTLLQAFTDNSVCPLLHSGFSTCEEKHQIWGRDCRHVDRKNEKDWSPIHSGEQSLQIITLKAAQAYLCKVPVEVEVTVAKTRAEK